MFVLHEKNLERLGIVAIMLPYIAKVLRQLLKRFHSLKNEPK